MKKLLLLFFIVKCGDVSAQSRFKDRYKLGIVFGGLTTNVTSGRVKSHSKGGYEIGIWQQLKISKNWSIQAELYYAVKGAGGFHANRPAIPGEYLLGLSYIELPILFQYQKKKFRIEFGPGLGVLLSQFEILNGALYPDMTDVYPFTKNELSFNVGLGYSFNEKWNLGLRYNQSLLPVRKQLPDITTKVYNRVFGIILSRRLMFRKSRVKEA